MSAQKTLGTTLLVVLASKVLLIIKSFTNIFQAFHRQITNAKLQPYQIIYHRAFLQKPIGYRRQISLLVLKNLNILTLFTLLSHFYTP